MLRFSRDARLSRFARRFRSDRRGASALEFAFVAPILVAMFFALANLSTALMTQRRASHSTASVGDLVAQFSTMDPAVDLPSALQSASDVMTPYPTSTLQVRISSIIVDGSAAKAPRVNWSCAPTANTTYTPLTSGSIVTLPSGLVSASGDSIVLVESTYAYTSPARHVLPFNTFNFPNAAYFRPRQTAEVALYPTTNVPGYVYTGWVSTSVSAPYSFTPASGSGLSAMTCTYQKG